MPSEGMPEREFRELDADHRVAFQEMIDYAFDVTRGPTSYESPGDTPDLGGRKFGVFENDDLRSVCTYYDFTARVRDDWLPMVGLASVATPPEHRRRGLVSHLIGESLDSWRGEYPISTLWPMKHSYYRQFGWALANKFVRYTCPPEALAFARDGASGNARRLAPGDWPRLQDVHKTHGDDIGLTIQRTEEWWRNRVFRSLGGHDRYVYGVERQDGADMDGYVVYTVESSEAGLRLRVNDIAYRDYGSLLRLLVLLADHDSQVEEVLLYWESETSLLDLVHDPDEVDCSVSAGPQVRVVDVERALSGLSYPPDVSVSVVLDVTDEFAPWNDGTFELRVTDGRGECRPVDDPDSSPRATVDIGTLSQLYVGYHSPARARRFAGLEVDDDAADALTALFPPRRVYLREFF